MKKTIKKILLCLIFIFSLFTFVACDFTAIISGISNEESTSSLGKLEILKSDIKLTQEQTLSQIKAEYLIENNGYKDSDEIISLVTLPEDALIDSFIEKSNIIGSLSEYATSADGIKQIKTIREKQDSLIRELENKGLIISVEHTYNTVINAVAVKTTYGNFKEISNLSNVKMAVLSDTFNRPQESSENDASAIVNVVDVYETGIFNSSSVDYTGEGTAVAVLDSGFDCSHSVFATQPKQEIITQQSISAVLGRTNASETTNGLELFDVYYSKKIPFVYDYADKDPDVSPFDTEHGTHVSGIIGGFDDVITGVAINTQLVLLKVFPDLDDGANTSDILAALEDAVLLGVDAINMSLGSSCGFAREEDGNVINDVYDKINASGISLLTAASNSYSSGFGGAQGNTNLVTNPDSGTVGSPSTYVGALSVASISGIKSKYILGNGSQIFFFSESNAITGDQNDFLEELGLKPGETKTYEYVTIPGAGLKVNYSSVGDLTGKIALVRRGDNTFEEKALNAKNAGAAACIIYNNIDGDILMSMGKSDHIPTISISKDDGTLLASRDTGTMTISYDYQAGPFMSDFSSWGPTPSLQLKPEITAHGGNITSSVPGGGYDDISGTSMATPNLCGIVVLIRQYLKNEFPNLTTKEISVMANQLLMSTATIIRNQEGNPYSPRKQGAGLASLYNAVNTKAYLTVAESEKTKIELYDDKEKTGVYTMQFNVVNVSSEKLTYDISLVGMTESVSTSDETHVSEKSNILGGNYEATVVSGGVLNGNKVTVNGNETATIKVVYTLSDEDKLMIDKLFPYGMYVEGFVKLTSDTEIDLNVPFLAFYGDWTVAPMFDKTYYEVESEAHNQGIDEEDKIKADYYATTPYGSYYYNYIIPLGTYLYDVDEEKYDVIPASTDHIAISNSLATIDGISAVYAGLLRNAKTMEYTITDSLTGEVVYEHTNYNATKAYSLGSSPVPNYEYLRISSYQLGLINNRKYEFKMTGLLDYGDGGATTNVRNTFSFDFYLDDEAPVLKDVSYEKIYDKTLKKDRYYINMVVYDNQYVQAITPIIFTSSSSYAFLTENPIPVYGEKGTDNKVRFEITDYLEDIGEDALLTSALGFSIDDYALNSNIYMCQLPGTKGDFKFTKDGTVEGTDLVILSMYEDEIVDLTKYLSTKDETADEEKDYLKHLIWKSSNEKVAIVEEGIIKCVKAGRATVTVQEGMDLKQAILIINVKERTEEMIESPNNVVNIDDITIDSLRFSYFDTLFAYSRAAQTSEIGDTGARVFVSSLSSINFYPGEKIQLHYDLDPWYIEDKYELSYESTNEEVAIVDEDGVVTALKKGNASIILNVKGSNIKARIRLTVKSEFIIEDRTLIAYKGLGGDVVIPDDEGILRIGSYAFCLFDTDRTIELTDEDYDANKIPSMNTTVKSVVVPDGVDEIQKYAFYNCTGLEKVVLPDSIKYIRECAFHNDGELESINLEKVQVIGREAFKDCKSLKEVDLPKIYSIGIRAFDGCSSLEYVDLTTLRNTGSTAFRNCTSLKEVVLSPDTKLSYAMFVNTGLTKVDIYEKVQIPAFCFARCENLAEVNLHNDLEIIGEGAFSECTKLTNFNILGRVEMFADQVFYGSTGLEKIVLPNNEFVLGNYVFMNCEGLKEVEFKENTKITEISGSVFEGTSLTTFTVSNENEFYSSNNELLLSKDGKTIIFAAVASDYSDYTIASQYTNIGPGAFCGVNVKNLTFSSSNLVVGAYAFANCEELVSITFPQEEGLVIEKHAFNYASELVQINNLDYVKNVGEYAFANSAVKSVVIGSDAVYGEGAFFRSQIEEVTIGANTTFGLGAFQNCAGLKTVNMPELGNVLFGRACFAYDTELATIDLSKVGKIIEDQTFYGCRKLKIADLQHVEEIGEYSFAECSSLSYLALPVVKKIGEGAFARYEQYGGGAPIITGVELPESLTSLGDGAFLGCESLLEIKLPSSLKNVGDFLFAYCVNLGKVELPENMKRVGMYSFAGCVLLTNINLENVEEIADYAFTSSEMLENVDLTNAVTIGEGAFAGTALRGDAVANRLTSIGMYAFQNTNFSSFTAENLEKIGEGAFQHNHSLQEFIFSNKLSEIGLIAFHDCTSLTNYYFLDGNRKVRTGVINDYALLDRGILYTYINKDELELKSVPANQNIDILTVTEGTVRIDIYAGNENKNVSRIVLPSTLKTIGNYAFYGCNSLNRVEFRSYTAPALEDSYNRNSELIESDPGYDALHGYFDIFGLELYYYNFIDLVGKKEPIKMILPANSDITGYDSLVYEVYFGKAENAERSEYVAMEQSMIDFLEYAKKIESISTIILNDETLINNALTTLNTIKQNATDFDISEEEWNRLVDICRDAKETLAILKLNSSKYDIKELQKVIDNLPDTFKITNLETIKYISEKLSELKSNERSLLDLTKYNSLVSSYNSYLEALEIEVAPVVNMVNETFNYIGATRQIITLFSLSLLLILRRKWFK